MAKEKAKAMRVTRQDVETYAILSEKVKALKAALDERKESFREQMEPGDTLVGYAYTVGLSAVPQTAPKPDYRTELIRAIGLPAVVKIEATFAARPKEDGTAKVIVSPNAEASAVQIQMGAKLWKQLQEAWGAGDSPAKLLKLGARA